MKETITINGKQRQIIRKPDVKSQVKRQSGDMTKSQLSFLRKHMPKFFHAQKTCKTLLQIAVDKAA